MSICIIVIILLILTFVYIVLDYRTENIERKMQYNQMKNQEKFMTEEDRKRAIIKKCEVPNLNTEQCYKSNQYECPIVNGSYLQCTNNYIPLPTTFNAPCNNRTFEATKPDNKISVNCYYDNIGWNRDKFKLSLK